MIVRPYISHIYGGTFFFVFITGVLALLAGCEKGDASSAPYYHHVIAQPLQLESGYLVPRYFVGQVEARQRAELGFELMGTLAEMAVDEGSVVEKGQLLASLDSGLLLAEVQQIEAQQEGIQAQLTLSTLQIKRQRELGLQGFASEQRIDELQAEISSLRAQFKREQARLESARTRLAKHTLKAPFRGEISRRYTEAGSIALAGQPVFQLLELGAVEARVGVPAKWAATLIQGAEMQVAIGGERRMPASVLAIAANVDALTHTASVRLSLPSDRSLVDGEMLYLVLPERVQRAGYWVPDTALAADVRGMWNVYVLVPSDKPGLYVIEARSVELLYMAEGRAFVMGAVNTGEQIVAAGLHRVVPGLLVRLQSQSIELPE